MRIGPGASDLIKARERQGASRGVTELRQNRGASPKRMAQFEAQARTSVRDAEMKLDQVEKDAEGTRTDTVFQLTSYKPQTEQAFAGVGDRVDTIAAPTGSADPSAFSDFKAAVEIRLARLDQFSRTFLLKIFMI